MSRFDYYIKNWKKMTVYIPDEVKIFKQNELVYFPGKNIHIQNFSYHYGSLHTGFYWDQGPDFSLDIPCLTISADGIDNKKLPALVKVRYIKDEQGGILCPLEYGRHWGEIKNLKDIPWNEKKNNCIWRGASTGNERIPFVKLYEEKYDVGISILCQGQNYSIKNILSIEEMLHYKYQISIPGNDKDSGLNWKLASNSIVLMVPPIIESWLMEGLLQPYVHYVPLKEDYSNLDTIIEWCQTHDKECIEINKNAKQFMSQFENIEVEKKLFNEIKKYYTENITLIG